MHLSTDCGRKYGGETHPINERERKHQSEHFGFSLIICNIGTALNGRAIEMRDNISMVPPGMMPCIVSLPVRLGLIDRAMETSIHHHAS